MHPHTYTNESTKQKTNDSNTRSYEMEACQICGEALCSYELASSPCDHICIIIDEAMMELLQVDKYSVSILSDMLEDVLIEC